MAAHGTATSTLTIQQYQHVISRPGTGYTSINGPAGTYILTKKGDSVKNPFGADVNNVIVRTSMIGKTLSLRFEVQGGQARSELNILPINLPTNQFQL